MSLTAENTRSLLLYNTEPETLIQASDGTSTWRFRLKTEPGWTKLVNRVGLFRHLFALRSQGAWEELEFCEAELLQGTVRPPIGAGQNVVMNGVTFTRSRIARNKEFLDSVFGGELTDDDYLRIPEDLRNRIVSPYDVVGDPKNPNEVFWSGTPEHCATTGGIAGIRGPVDLGDPNLVPSDITEPELTFGMSSAGSIEWLGVGGDQTARTTERRSSLLLFRAKVHLAAAVLSHGVYVPNPGAGPCGPFDIRMTITRAGKILFDDVTSTSKMVRSISELADAVHSCGPWASGTVVFCGTDLVPARDFTLLDGDVVRVSSDTLGTWFENTAQIVKCEPRRSNGLEFA